jgi:hypothetical protein
MQCPNQKYPARRQQCTHRSLRAQKWSCGVGKPRCGRVCQWSRIPGFGIRVGHRGGRRRRRRRVGLERGRVVWLVLGIRRGLS